MWKKISALSLMAVGLMTSGFGCKVQSTEVKQAMKPVTLNYWRAWDEPDDFQELIDKYTALHPNVTINYRKLRYDEYEKEIINALAEDRGPDIFSIENGQILNYQNKIAPLPDVISMVYPVQKGSIKKEIVYELKKSRSLSIKDLRSNFVDVVSDDVLVDNKIMGLPLSVDTLAMFYHKDLFNAEGIVTPPAYWDRNFQDIVKRLTKRDTQGNIVQAGAALGGGSNVERSQDILAALMLQSKAPVVENGRVVFNLESGQGSRYYPGVEAIRFYSDFANVNKEVYCWDKSLGNSFDLFVRGQAAVMFGYSYHIPLIVAARRSGFSGDNADEYLRDLNIGISKLPQIASTSQPINIANYWVETVSKKSQHVNEAWDFVQFITKAENVTTYLNKTKKPTALRSLIEKQLSEEYLDIFASQLLTAKSWYRGYDSVNANKIIANLVDGVLDSPEQLEAQANLAASKLQQTLKPAN
ncbi:MAG TPA: extracellular solute-binding protein [bacterium]|nr:extracellular solute-binding protein [bacterium]